VPLSMNTSQEIVSERSQAGSPVGIQDDDDVDGEAVNDVRVLAVVLHQLLRDVGHGGWADPLAGMNATVDPDLGLVRILAATDFQHVQVAPLGRLPDDVELKSIQLAIIRSLNGITLTLSGYSAARQCTNES